MDNGWGEEGEGKMNGSIYTNICKEVANGNLPYDSGNSNWGSVITQRGGKWQVLMYDRKQSNIVKQSSIN